VIEELTSRPRICCSVIDSDKDFPTDGFGDTAAAVQKFKDLALYPCVGIVETTGKELENMAHRQFVDEKYSPDVNHAAAVKLLKHTDDTGDYDLRLFYDFKKGLVLADIHKHGTGSPHRVFWEAKLQVLGTLFNQRHHQFKCTETPTCVAEGCACRISNGLGTKILQAFIGYIDQHGEKKVAGDIQPPLLEEWRRIGQFLRDWGCARDRVRT
jgi:hypothetical protein